MVWELVFRIITPRFFLPNLAKPDLMAKPQQRPGRFFVDENISVHWMSHGTCEQKT